MNYDENPYSDLPFWLQRNWADWGSLTEFGMYYWTEQCFGTCPFSEE